MRHKLWAFPSQKFLQKKKPLASKNWSQMRFLAVGVNRADAPCFCTKKKGSSNALHYVNYGKVR